MTDERKKEFIRRISNADPVQMITVLYDMTLAYLEDALAAVDDSAFKDSLHHAGDCIRELQFSVIQGVSPAGHLTELYVFLHKELTEALICKDKERLKAPVSMIAKLRDTYRELEKEVRMEPVMANAQQVYAGLTYGPGATGSEMIAGDNNRGYMA